MVRLMNKVLLVGVSMIELPKYDGLNTTAFSKMFKSLTTSYKLFWFKAVFDEVIAGNSEILVSDIVDSMIEDAFEFIHKYKLGFSVIDQLEASIRSIPPDYRGNNDYKSLSKVIDPKYLLKFRKEIQNYVPYRLLSTFYEDTKSKKDNIKNSTISYFMSKDDNAFYQYDKVNRKVLVSPAWRQYIIKNQNLILGWYKYHLIKFLQSRNPSTPNIPAKIDSDRKDINKQRKFWLRVANENAELLYDIYLGKPISNRSTEEHGILSLDHVLPYEFVSHDQMWNLIPAHKNINSKKGTDLPSKDYIRKAVDLQYKFFDTARKITDLTNKEKKYLLEYEQLNSELNYLNPKLDKSKFEFILLEQLQSLYSIAYNQGFDVWKNE